MNTLVPSGLQPTNEASPLEPSSVSSDEVHCWVSFGGNVGEVRATFDAALALMSLHCHIQLGQRSGLYCSAPMGTQAGNRFLNSVCGLTTRLSPHDLLSVLQSVETQLGRVREIDWGPRTLDLDLLSYGEQILNEPRLVIPHPALTYRRFVLDPLVEIDPTWQHPVFAESSAQILDRLKHRPLKIALSDLTEEQICELYGELLSRFPDVQLVCEHDATENVLTIQVASPPVCGGKKSVDLRRSPGDLLEKLTAAFTAIFDSPVRISEW